MEAIKEPKTTSLVIEVKSGTNDAGADTFRKKRYSNVKVDAPVSNVVIVAKSIAAVLSSSTRYFMLNEVSIIDEA